MAKVNNHAELIGAEGFRLIPWKSITRGGMNPFRELRALAEVVKQYRTIRPDIVHLVHNKPILYGGLAARWCRVPALNTVAGLGQVFAKESLRNRILRGFMLIFFRVALGNDRSVAAFQNNDDREYFLKNRIILPDRATLIRGSGVDLEEFSATPIPSGTPIVMLAARLLWEKGVREFVAAAEATKRQGIDARFVLVGDPDPANPTSVPESLLKQWSSAGLIEWWGRKTGMAQVLSRASIICLPTTYREGVPKVLIEAASCCRPIVTTDTAGCRDIVHDGENGILVPPGDSEALVRALRSLLIDRRQQERMGRRGRQIAAAQFSEEYVIAQTSDVYRQLLPACPPLTASAFTQVP
jgi:glycosyltransferase involved in cell wall biosynthesis